ncbi:hypothetical protein [Reinekea sp.]|jgi:hypothetical protein|uniref:hypothetical protein n=1 Tax=Reinekea sp. TaxID=1970455 RepID=UPI00398A4C0C
MKFVITSMLVTSMFLSACLASTLPKDVYFYFDTDESGPLYMQMGSFHGDPSQTPIEFKYIHPPKLEYNYLPASLNYMPTYAKFKWGNRETQINYIAEVKLPDNLAVLLENLSPQVWLYSQEEPIEGYTAITINLTQENEVVISLINSAAGLNIKTRETIELARVKGEVLDSPEFIIDSCGCELGNPF